MKMIKVYYDGLSGRGYKYLNTQQIVSVEPLKDWKDWKDCVLVKSTLNEEFYINESIEEVLKSIEGVEV